MKKFFIAIIILLLISTTGCLSNDSESVRAPGNTDEIENNLEETSKSEIEEEKVEEDIPVNPLEEIDMSLNPNEMGEIMILMYHGIAEEETTWERTPDNFRKDLEYMYQNGYRMISLNDYAKGIINTEAGYTPIILTFDDGRQNNFNIIEKDNGEIEIDPDCAVGILEEFKEKYPDFNVTASFFLGTNIFGQDQYKEYKLKFLAENGYDIGNHTYSHNPMADQGKDEINFELGSINNMINSYLPDYKVETLALPLGSNPRDEFLEDAVEGEFEGNRYKHIAILDVGWRPAFSPFDTDNDFTSLYRVTASEINVDGTGIYDYFQQYADGRRNIFISDGNPDVVTIPKKFEEYINMDMVGDRILNIYE